ncbi:Uncharacterised protein [Phocoenobacter uteri]|uniref:Uncharacterized protein n=2 Tax=Phocoenobacter uteri TaxID=146806 RepID=A0A379CCC3_9PAST|nr:hypothetical protein [Phocoenobacter uteri]SUB59386.1 Uncharacterised protein [Phocoenobacter uteri]
MLTPEEKRKVMLASARFPLGKFYIFKVWNLVFPIPYFFLALPPTLALIITYLNSSRFDGALNLKLTSFSQHLDGYVSNNILLIYDAYTIGILIMMLFVFLIVPLKLFHKPKFFNDMKILADWYVKEDLPQKNRKCVRKNSLYFIAMVFGIELMLWFVYPEPRLNGMRMKMFSNIYYSVLFINSMYLGCALALGQLISAMELEKLAKD